MYGNTIDPMTVYILISGWGHTGCESLPMHCSIYVLWKGYFMLTATTSCGWSFTETTQPRLHWGLHTKLCFTEHKYHQSTEIDCTWDIQEDTSYRVLVLHASVNVHVQLLHVLGKVLDEYGPPIQWWPYCRWAEVRETTDKVLNSVRAHKCW